MKMKHEGQLNLYDREENKDFKSVDELDSDNFRKMAQDEVDERKRFHGVFTSGLVADLIIEQNSKSEKKISLDNPEEWKKVINRLKDLGFHVDQKELDSYIEGLKSDRAKKNLKIEQQGKIQKKWGAEAGLPTGDRD